MPNPTLLTGRFTVESQNPKTLMVTLKQIIENGDYLKDDIYCEIPGSTYAFFLALEQHNVYLGHTFKLPEGLEQPDDWDIITINGVRRSIFAIDTTIQTLVAYLQLAPSQTFSQESMDFLKQQSVVSDLLGLPRETVITEEMLQSLFGNPFKEQRRTLIQMNPYPTHCMRVSFGDPSVWLDMVLNHNDLDDWTAKSNLGYESHIPAIGKYYIKKEERLVPAVSDEIWAATAMSKKVTVYSADFMSLCYANIQNPLVWLEAVRQKMQSLTSVDNKAEFLYCLESKNLPYDPVSMPIDNSGFRALIFKDRYLNSSIFKMLCRYEATSLFLYHIINRGTNTFYEHLRHYELNGMDKETRKLLQVMAKNLYDTTDHQSEKLRFALDFYIVLESPLREEFFAGLTEETLLQAIKTSSHDTFCALMVDKHFAPILRQLSKENLASLIVFGWSQVAFNKKKPLFYEQAIKSCGLPAFITALKQADWISDLQVDAVCMPLENTFKELSGTDEYEQLQSTRKLLKMNWKREEAKTSPNQIASFGFWSKPNDNTAITSPATNYEIR